MKRNAARTPGTPEFKELQEHNEAIDAHNHTLGPGARKGRKQRITAERLWKIEKLERNHKKGGLDFVYYAFKIYENELFPYIQELKALIQLGGLLLLKIMLVFI
jgi:hypothetical protein